MSERSSRAHRVPVPDTAHASASTGAPDYASAFSVTTSGTDAQSAEVWARATFEGAPTAIRWFVLLGWRTVLRLELAPRSSPAAVLGWSVVASTPATMTLDVHSALIAASKVVEVAPAAVTMTTFVRFERRLGRIIWSALAPVHHLTEPLLLTLAARRTDLQPASRRNAGS